MSYITTRILFFLLLVCGSASLFFTGGCVTTDEDLPPFDSLRNSLFERVVPFYFDDDPQGWEGGFANYAAVLQDSLALTFQHATLPPVFEKTGGALQWTGYNFQNNLFMFGWRRIGNLEPNRPYVLSFDVAVGYQIEGNEFRLRSHENRLNIKVGAINYPPRITDDEVLGRIIVNFDKGAQQTTDGNDMMWLGELVAGDLKYKDKILTNAQQRLFGVVSNENGEIWILVGIESSVPLRHSIYFDSVVLYYR